MRSNIHIVESMARPMQQSICMVLFVCSVLLAPTVMGEEYEYFAEEGWEVEYDSEAHLMDYARSTVAINDNGSSAVYFDSGYVVLTDDMGRAVWTTPLTSLIYLSAVDIDNNGRYVMAAGAAIQGGKIWLMDYETGDVVFEYLVTYGDIISARISKDGSTVVFGTDSSRDADHGCVFGAIDVSTDFKHLLYSYTTDPAISYQGLGGMRSVSVSYNGDFMAAGFWEFTGAGDTNGKIFYADLRVPMLAWYHGGYGEISAVDMDASGTKVVAGTVDGYVIYWGDANNTLGTSWEKKWIDGMVTDLDMSDDGRFIVVGGGTLEELIGNNTGKDGKLSLLDGETGETVWDRTDADGTDIGTVTSVAITNDGRIISATTIDGWILALDAILNKLMFLEQREEAVLVTDIATDGTFVAGGDRRFVFIPTYFEGIPWYRNTVERLRGIMPAVAVLALAGAIGVLAGAKRKVNTILDESELSDPLDGLKSSEIQPEDYNSKSVIELKAILKERGLPVSGKKAVLVERLGVDTNGQKAE